jgi:exopolysaccharide biosynthesis polyprenyl glycosylphosphotransferase
LIGESAIVSDEALALEWPSRPEEGTRAEQTRLDTRAHGRGWLVRRALLAADMAGLTIAFVAASELVRTSGPGDTLQPRLEYLAFVLTLPVWTVVAKLHGLYDRDEARADHSTVDDVVGVFHLVTIGAWIVYIVSLASGLADPDLSRLVLFWILAIGLVTTGRSLARAACRRTRSYLQNTIIVGAGDIGQLIARKVLHHPEYGINLVGFVDTRPKQRRGDLGDLAIVGLPEELPEIVERLDVERIIIAFSNEQDNRTMEVVRPLRDYDLQIDVVPRLFDLIGPRVGVHAIEGLPLLGVPPARPTASSRLLKRAIDVAVALIGLVLAAPLFMVIAWKIRRDSPGPVFFRQRRLGLHMREFTVLKFRTMRVGTDGREHQDYIKSIMSAGAEPQTNGMYKLERPDAVTHFGRVLRKTSLDELPQLINVLKGEMSIVGPRPCLPSETEHFQTHHFERFLVPAGITGLWQVTARASSTFREALEMDVVYVRGWSLGLDLGLLLRTPFAVLHQRNATA